MTTYMRDEGLQKDSLVDSNIVVDFDKPDMRRLIHTVHLYISHKCILDNHLRYILVHIYIQNRYWFLCILH